MMNTLLLTIQTLYIHWNPSEVMLRIGGFELRWYSMCWLVGLTVGYLLMRRLYRQQKLGMEKFEPLFIYVFLGILVGARLGHCLFYEPQYFLSAWDHMVEMIIPVRHLDDGQWKFVGYQGLASHGGVAGLLAALWLYCRRMKMNGWVVLDNFGICAPITSCFIRLGNLMNSEIIGKPTDMPWAFIFERVDMQPRHPGQLYEAIAYLVFFIIILYVYRKNPRKVGTGLFFGLCLTLIFTFRFIIEYTKEIQEAFEAGLPMDMGQILSLPLIAIGVWSIVRSRKQKNA